MNIVVIEEDEPYRKILSGFLEHLGLDYFLFSSFDNFYTWNKKHNLSIEFIFITVYREDSFNEASFMKKQVRSDHFLSVVFLLNEHRDENYIKSLKYGDGYLLKPFDSELLLSSIHYHSKRSKLYEMLARKNEKLIEYHTMVKREHEIVESIFANHCEQHLLKTDGVRFHISPASVFNGDVLLTAQGPSGSLYLAVGDVTGHGLPAAIGAMPVYSTFRAMAKKGKKVGSIASEMNTALRSILPDNMMMAIILMELNFANGQATIWSGGMPDIVIVDGSAQIKQKIISRHSPLSVLEPELFRKDVDVIQLAQGDRIYFYTDGIEEAKDSHGNMFGAKRFEALFSGEPTLIFDNIIRAYEQYIEGSQQDDDITLAEVFYHDQLVETELINPINTPATKSIPWEMTFALSAQDLKETDPVAQMIQFLDNSIDVDVHQDLVSTIVSELYNNALEHGILEMDSDIKSSEDGFVDYYIERQKKLSDCEQANIDITMHYDVEKEYGKGLLTITITDSGKGFSYQADKVDLNNNHRIYGRGIGLLKSLCQDVQYTNNGRTAIAKYYIDHTNNNYFS